MKKSLIICIIFSVFMFPFSKIYCVVGLNDLEEIFPPAPAGESTGDNSIRSMMIDGAALFLES